ncbi:MAG: adenylate/guanylate cyclase domain-containing protein, partial [Hyphomicrobiaceae bacterium]
MSAHTQVLPALEKADQWSVRQIGPSLLSLFERGEGPIERIKTRLLLFLITVSVVGELALITLDISRGADFSNNVVVLACVLVASALLATGRKTLAIYLTLLPFTIDFFRSFYTSGGIETHAMPLFFLLIIEAVLLLRTGHALAYVTIMLALLNADPLLGISQNFTAPDKLGGSERTAAAFVVANAIAIAITALFTVVFVSMQRYYRRLEQQNAHLDDLVRERTRQLEAEQQRSEELLQNVLPSSVAARMKSGEANPVDQVPYAGVLFADIVGFTELSSSLRPAELVRLLNDIFTEFDRLVADHGLEKIKTIGDAYMVAAGIPEQSPKSLERLADFAVDLRDLMKVRSSGSPLQLRIGLNAGPVVAGVIGSRKFLYDLWGETVNIASRMESHGVPGLIHLPACLCQQLSDRFTFT